MAGQLAHIREVEGSIPSVATIFFSLLVVFIVMEEKITITKDQLFKVMRLNEAEKKETVEDIAEDGDIVDMTIKENGNVYIKSHIVYSMSNGDENVQFFENDETMDNTVIGIIHSVQNKVIKLK